MTADWQRRIEDYCAAWTTKTGQPDFDRLATFYASDPDVVIYDSLPPFEGFAGFAAMRSIYPGLRELTVAPNHDLRVKLLARGSVAVTTFTSKISYTFSDGRRFAIDVRHSDVWESRDGRWVIVHEHPSTVVNP